MPLSMTHWHIWNGDMEPAAGKPVTRESSARISTRPPPPQKPLLPHSHPHFPQTRSLNPCCPRSTNTTPVLPPVKKPLPVDTSTGLLSVQNLGERARARFPIDGQLLCR